MLAKRTDRKASTLLLGALVMVACTDPSPNDSVLDTGSGSGIVSPSAGGPITGVRTLESSSSGGPSLSSVGLDDAGIHLRRFYAWTDPDKARADLGATVFEDGGDRSAWADVLAQEGGTLVALFLGLQTSHGVIDADIAAVDVDEARLTVTVATQTPGHCAADGAFASPFRLLHIAAAAPTVLFREAIMPCVDVNASVDPASTGQIAVEFLDDTTARIDWEPPTLAEAHTRYDVIDTDREELIYDGTNEPTYTIGDLVPGVIVTRRIVPIDGDGQPMSRGESVAVMVDAPTWSMHPVVHFVDALPATISTG